MSHTCHAYNCNRPVPPEMFMCRPHWFSLPKPLRNNIWTAYRNGQCDDYQISRAYANAAQAAIHFLAKKEGHVLDGTELELALYDKLTELT